MPEWFSNIAKQKAFLISGPCSAESETQVISTAKALKKLTPTRLFRAGLWKPRTIPNQFEGVGQQGIPWMKEAKKCTGLPICTEVALPKHVEACLYAKFDALWIGTRTTASPFAIQELAHSLQGIDIPVFIKNPINPDLRLWSGAIERLKKAGVSNIIGIHRGFSVFPESKYRYEPIWELAKTMKNNYPTLPLLCDPSHISGNRVYLEEIIKQAKTTNIFNGFMIESHLNPKKALTDSAQQITPTELSSLMHEHIF